MRSPRQRTPRLRRRSERGGGVWCLATTGEFGVVSYAPVSRGSQRTVRTFPIAGVTDAPRLLGTIARVERIARVHLRNAGRIEVVAGPGSFSRVRLGVVTANALAWALGVRLTVGGRTVRRAMPIYGKPPHIG